MFRCVTRRLLCATTVTLANGTRLKGTFNPALKDQLLEGVAVLPDGRVFKGKFNAEFGFPEAGSQLEEDGDLYQGSFNRQWQREGLGEAWLSDGTHYVGEFKEDDLVKGKVTIPNGTTEVVFEGTLKDENFVHGTLTEHDFTYTGDFVDNQPHGKGKIVFSSGAEQEGTFFNGKLHGPDCKMKLESGFVYVGEFIDGAVKRGILYTPTYTYEGEFNEHGRAHGEGSQTYLINEPRLTFTGIWDNGAMTRGTCIDEYGSPVDWQDNHRLQNTLFSDASASSDDESVAVNSYCGSKLKEADQLNRELNESYARDAEAVAKKSGVFPSKMDLGYEGGVRSENAALENSTQKQMADIESSRKTLSEQAKTFKNVADSIDGSVIGEINENMAKIQFSRQLGAQQLSGERVDEQFERFLKNFDKPSSSKPNEKDKDALNIEGNSTWQSFIPPK